jgi:hypothetical protein
MCMSNTRRLVTLWFIADMVLALLPPLYWAASGPCPAIFGVPLSMAYFLLIRIFISASIVVAFVAERRDGSLS